MTDKQLPIPGLEPHSCSLASPFKRHLESTSWPEDRLRLLENRVAALELELAILKIQMERVDA